MRAKLRYGFFLILALLLISSVNIAYASSGNEDPKPKNPPVRGVLEPGIEVTRDDLELVSYDGNEAYLVFNNIGLLPVEPDVPSNELDEIESIELILYDVDGTSVLMDQVCNTNEFCFFTFEKPSKGLYRLVLKPINTTRPYQYFLRWVSSDDIINY